MRCAGVATVALGALALAALLAGAGAEPEPAACEPDPTDSTASHPSCVRLAQRYHDKVTSLGVRCASVRGRPKYVALVWGSDVARAAAALLHAVLRYALRYRRVRLWQGPHNIDDFAEPYKSRESIYKDLNLVVGLSTAVNTSPGHTWLTGTRLRDVGFSSVTARCRLHAHLAPSARARAACRQHTRWTFYADTTALSHCAFIDAAFNLTTCEVYNVDCNATLDRLKVRANAHAVPFNMHRVNRTTLVHRLRTANHSFLFLDYDIWKGDPNVSIVEPPPCVAANPTCQQELDTDIALRFADVDVLNLFAPELFNFYKKFKPSVESLRWILEREVDGYKTEDAACEWALNNTKDLESWNLDEHDIYSYWVKIYFCHDDPDYDNYNKKIIDVINREINNNTFALKYSVYYYSQRFNCFDANKLSNKFIEKMLLMNSMGLMGVVAAEAASLASIASAQYVPLLLVDAVPDDAPDAAASAVAAWRVAGRPRHLALALQHFVLASGWTRLAVLSQQETKLARDYNAALDEAKLLLLHHYRIPLKLTESLAEKALENLLDVNARIVFVNADAEAAAVILTTALKQHMSYEDGFVWIVRDWRPNNATSKTKHFTVSFWRRGEEDVPSDAGRPELRKKLSEKLSGRPWPPHTASLADALLTLAEVFNHVFRHHPSTREDIRTEVMMRLLNDRLATEPVTGITHLLHYKERSIEETFVFVDEWSGDTWHRRLATWRVNASAHSDAVRGNYTRPRELPLHDGASRCIVHAGDPFQPTCYDGACAAVLLLLLLMPPALLLVRSRLAYHMQKRQVEIMARRQHVANVLAGYLVKREALELREELGAGRFGCVHLALLRAPARAIRYVAAKALRDNAAPAEESEFLHEACTIASLNHKHVVRLVGVCIADGPPLVLMELAFFGDLLGYLRARRHLVEGGESEALAACEAEHVSAEALTRLAREAAAALEYLAKRGVVHCDVRAANCLVDAQRSLKLADFGMARATTAVADGAPEYACRRRGLFPVLWMAPESLAHGVFSAASDVWALGVLVLELVTLGARPYGTMSPLHVLEYVASGGRPPLPLDATPQTRGLARLCWARVAERRPSAAEVCAYLSARPRALRPALMSERDEPADADSGFGESPSTELLPPDSPLDSLDRLEVLVATP